MLKCWTGSSKPTTKTAEPLVYRVDQIRGIALKLAIN